MPEPYLAEVRIFGFNFPPNGWALCNGQILPINQNQALYSLLGTTYGGDGRTTFGLPDLRGRSPIHKSSSHPLGQSAGQETVSLSVAEMPAHTHTAQANPNPATTDSANNGANLLAKSPEQIYRTPTTLVNMAASSITNTGNNQGHENMQPFLTLNFSIALQGLFPPRN